MADYHDYQPIENHVLVAIEARYVQKHAAGTSRLALPPVGGWDQRLIETIEAGQVSAYELEVEAADDAHQTLVQQGIVLAVPRRLSSAMVLCADPSKSKPKTCADIQDEVAVGDTVHIERHYLESDENGNNQYEISPGVYRLPYSAVVAVIVQPEPFYLFSKRIKGDFTSPIHLPAFIRPIGGYVLLSRVWAEDVVDEVLDGCISASKVRYSKTVPGLIDQYNVPPLPCEGIVAHIGVPLRGTGSVIKPGDHVVFEPGYALMETIAGTEYLVVRQEYCLAVRETAISKIEVEIGGKTAWADPSVWKKVAEFKERQADQMLPPWMRKYPDPEKIEPTLASAGLMGASHFIPLDHPSYLA